MRSVKTHGSVSRKGLIFALAAVFLLVYLAHDLIFLSADAGSSILDSSAFSRTDQSTPLRVLNTSVHHCPFCSGFVDTHAEIAVLWHADSTDMWTVELVSRHSAQPATYYSLRAPPLA
jgi:hypothetical protein